MIEEIGFGGSCHWCTEAIFMSLRGVLEVKQGWIASLERPESFSEAVIVQFDPEIIPLHALVNIHLHTHSSTSAHSMRDKYRSAVYAFSSQQQEMAAKIIQALQAEIPEPLITEVVEYYDFKLNKAEYINYFYSDPSKPFCQNIVNPKLKQLLEKFSDRVNSEKLSVELLEIKQKKGKELG